MAFIDDAEITKRHNGISIASTDFARLTDRQTTLLRL